MFSEKLSYNVKSTPKFNFMNLVSIIIHKNKDFWYFQYTIVLKSIQYHLINSDLPNCKQTWADDCDGNCMHRNGLSSDVRIQDTFSTYDQARPHYALFSHRLSVVVRHGALYFVPNHLVFYWYDAEAVCKPRGSFTRSTILLRYWNKVYKY